MPARTYADDVLKPGREREYTIASTGTGYNNIFENLDALQTQGSKFGRENAMRDMCLECDAVAADNIITISHPSGEPRLFWFVAPVLYETRHTYRFKAGNNEPVALNLLHVNGTPLTMEAWVPNAIVVLLRSGNNAYATFPSVVVRGYLPTSGGTINGQLVVTGLTNLRQTIVNSSLSANSLSVSGAASITGNTTINGTLTVGGRTIAGQGPEASFSARNIYFMTGSTWPSGYKNGDIRAVYT